MKRITFYASALLISLSMSAQSQTTNVFDNIIAPSPDHTYLEAALIQEGLEVVLQDGAATLTVFAPTDQAFTDLATALGTDITGILALPNLTDILKYHVLGTVVPASAVTNGLIATPLSSTNTLKMTLTSTGGVFANQAQVTTPDVNATNGTVHITNGVLLPNETVVDIAIDNGFSSLATAVITAELLPALTDPLGTFTVFAPTNQAFDDLATALGTDINGLLALSNLADILTYHVLGSEVPSSGVTNGLIASPLSTTNTLKLTVKGTGEVFVNQAEVTAFDITSENGTVHVLDAVVLPYETSVDVAIDNGFTSLAAAVIKAELLPALTNPLTELTVFAPTNDAFDDLAVALGTDLNGVLASPELTNILLYHVVSGTVTSGDLTNGAVPTLNGQTINVDLTSGVLINSSNVTTPDIIVDNGVVHVIDAVLVPAVAGLDQGSIEEFRVYPNPANDNITIDMLGNTFQEVMVHDLNGRLVLQSAISNNKSFDITSIKNGTYILTLVGNDQISTQKLQIL